MKKTTKYREDPDTSAAKGRCPDVERRTPTVIEKAQARRRHQTNERIAAVSRVSAAIAQQFNDPLQAITNVLGGIHRRGSLDQEDMPLVDLAYQEVKKLNQLARELREFYQPTLGKTDLFSIKDELEKIIEDNRQQLTEKGILLTTDFAENVPLIHAVAEQIKNVFQELLGNAILACEEDDTIHISTRLEDDTVVVRIQDSGCGIDPDILSQLFEPFGTGRTRNAKRDLTLAISYANITLHGGTIEVEVEDGVLTIFKVILPAHPQDNSSGFSDKDT